MRLWSPPTATPRRLPYLPIQINQRKHLTPNSRGRSDRLSERSRALMIPPLRQRTSCRAEGALCAAAGEEEEVPFPGRGPLLLRLLVRLVLSLQRGLSRDQENCVAGAEPDRR